MITKPSKIQSHKLRKAKQTKTSKKSKVFKSKEPFVFIPEIKPYLKTNWKPKNLKTQLQCRLNITLVNLHKFTMKAINITILR